MDEIPHFLFRIGIFYIQLAAVVADFAECTVQGKVKDIAVFFQDNIFSIFIFHCPGRLHAESRLEIGFRRGKVAKHENTCPRFHCHASGQFSTGKSDGLAFQRIFHGPPYRTKRIQPDAGRSTCAHVYLIFMVENIGPFFQQVLHGIAGSYVWKEPECMVQYGKHTAVRIGHHRFLLLSQFQIIH